MPVPVHAQCVCVCCACEPYPFTYLPLILSRTLTPALQANRPLESSHPFEQLKRLVYLHNTPASVGAEVAGSRLVEEVAQYSRSRP